MKKPISDFRRTRFACYLAYFTMSSIFPVIGSILLVFTSRYFKKQKAKA